LVRENNEGERRRRTENEKIGEGVVEAFLPFFPQPLILSLLFFIRIFAFFFYFFFAFRGADLSTALKR